MPPRPVRPDRESVDTDCGGGSSQRLRAQDQEIEQRYANLLTPIRDLTKNWEVDIAAYLDQYLEELSQVSVTYQAGEATINFTQAAFLIQGSACVYGKKVEYLYGLVNQMAGKISHGSIPDQEAQGTAKESNATSHRHKKDYGFTMHEDMELAENLDDLPGPLSSRGASARKSQLKRQRRVPLALVIFEEDKHTRLFDLKGDLVGFKVDYGLHNMPRQSSGGLKAVLCGLEHEHATTEIPRLEHSDVPDPAGCNGCSISDDSPMASPLRADSPDMMPPCTDIGAFEECAAKSDMMEEEIPLPPPRLSSCAKREPVKEEIIIVVKRFYDPMEDHKENKPIKVRRRTKKRSLDQDGSTTNDAEPIVPFIWAKEGQYPKLFAKEMELKKSGEVPPGAERLVKKALQAMKDMGKSNHLMDKQGFEDAPQEVLDGADAIVDAPCCDSEPEDKDLDLVDFGGADYPPDDTPAPGAAATEDSSEKDSYEKLVHSYLQEFQEPLTDFQLSDLQTRVAEWETRIRPLLDEEEKREAFDIRTYCGRLLEHFGEGPAKQTLRFQKVCEGRPTWEVPRYFASSLQLANNYNVELSTDGILEKGMDTLELTLLSRRQHFEELEDFGAPNASEIAPVERKRKQAKKRVVLTSHPEDPGDVLRENPVVPDPFESSWRNDVRLPQEASSAPSSQRRVAPRSKTRMRAVAAMLADDSSSSDAENDESLTRT